MDINSILRKESLHLSYIDNDAKRLSFVQGVCFLQENHDLETVASLITTLIDREQMDEAEGLIEALNFYRNIVQAVGMVGQVEKHKDFGKLKLMKSTEKAIRKYYNLNK